MSLTVRLAYVSWSMSSFFRFDTWPRNDLGVNFFGSRLRSRITIVMRRSESAWS